MKIKDKIKEYTSKTYTTNENYEVCIIDWLSSKNCTIQFKDESRTILKNIRYEHIKNGSIKNPNNPSVFGRGYFGLGRYLSKIDGKITKAYNTWYGMLERCFCEKLHRRQPRYIGCSVYKPWLNFQNFAEWFFQVYNPETMEGWHLDKDILVKGNKVYSPETCCFVPQSLNSLFVKGELRRGSLPIGVHTQGGRFKASISVNNKVKNLGYFDNPEEAFKAYKIAKEFNVKNEAVKWKSKIHPLVYEAIWNYKVDELD